MKRTQHGFTLVELMMVVAIIGVLSAVMIGMSARTNGANASNVAEQVSSEFNLCKMRAVSTRRWHRCEVSTTAVTVYQWSATGMAVPAGTCTLPATNCYQGVERISIPAGIVVWNAQATIDILGGTSIAQNTSLVFDFDFRPDGSSTGGTVFFTDTNNNHKARVLVYKSTGSSYVRQNW
jgi:prepilin-type N-terminal cleavage/methylation domain-containing protein